jgi:hypothetical protein
MGCSENGFSRNREIFLLGNFEPEELKESDDKV